MKRIARLIWIPCLLTLCGLSARAQTEAAEAVGTVPQHVRLSFADSPLELVLQTYELLTGRVLLRAPNLSASITLNTRTSLPREEALTAIESVLAMNGIGIVPMGERFAKVVPTATVRQEGLVIGIGRPEAALSETDALISRVIELENVTVAEALPILQTMIRGTGKIQPIERTNSLLITDTSVNMRRILEVLEYMDRPAVSRVETRVYELQFAEAAAVAQRLNELIADSQAQDAQARRTVAARTRPAPPAPPTPPGVIRPPQPATADAEADLAERGVVTGRVKIVADERTNIMIIISPPANFVFFDHVIAVLDRPTEPEVQVRVYALDYADAEEVATLLNQFLSSSASPAADRPATSDPSASDADMRGQILREFIARRAEERARTEVEGDSGIGSLSPQTKILADKRSNSLLIMGRRRDVESLVDVVIKLDVKLAQVLIEVVVLEITLSDSLNYGLDWLQRSITLYPAGSGGSAAGAAPTAAFGGGFAAAASPGFRDATAIDRNVPLSNAGMTYYMTLFNLNMDAILRLASKSGEARVLSTPVIMTTDNTEASIISSEQRPVVTQTSTTAGGEIRSSYEYRDIGIKLTVKPRINPDRYVVLDITQTADTPGEEVRIDNNLVPRIFRRELKAKIAVPHRGTVALGGLIQTDQKDALSRIPILGDIPLIGWLFRGADRSKARTELLVLITPYVITTPDEARRETLRLHDRSSVSETAWYQTWPDGDIAVEKRAAAAGEIPLRGRSTRPVAQIPEEPAAESSAAGEVLVEKGLELMPWVREALEQAP